MDDLYGHLTYLYGTERSPQLQGRVQSMLDRYRARIPRREYALSEQDVILIAYGDQVFAPHEKPLQTLNAFCMTHLAGLVSGIHILPFFPSSSDDGFSVVDYRSVDPALGDWQEIALLGEGFRLMFDAVINHASSRSAWFQGFLHGEPRYRDFFIPVNDAQDLSQVVRPRTSPLLTSFAAPSGETRVWTTFSADQVDLNYMNPEVLLEILDVLLGYVEHGASFLRLDAIAYVWKEPGTPCIHLPQTHRVIQFLRAALNQIAPQVRLVTETNVAHAENISYFGDGTNEAQLVYNFALPPLILHSLQTSDAGILSKWASTLSPPSENTAFFNFLASHDGIGLNAARGILSEAEIHRLVESTLDHGGMVSCKQNVDGSQSPYELNINYFDALSDPGRNEPQDLQVDRFIVAQAVMLSLAGLPGIYFHSLFGSRGWPAGVKQTGHYRAINREKPPLEMLQAELAQAGSLRSQVFKRFRQLLLGRRDSPAFHPHGRQRILDLHPAVFALERISPGGQNRAFCLHNLSPRRIPVSLANGAHTDLFTGEPLPGTRITLNPYQVLWAKS
jgi:sucrose phosphorylase